MTVANLYLYTVLQFRLGTLYTFERASRGAQHQRTAWMVCAHSVPKGGHTNLHQIQRNVFQKLHTYIFFGKYGFQLFIFLAEIVISRNIKYF